MVSRIGLGTATWGFGVDLDDAAAQLQAFVAAGGNLLDTSNAGPSAGKRQLGSTDEIVGRVVINTM